MTVTAEQLQKRVKAKSADDVAETLATAEALIAEALDKAYRQPAAPIRDEMVLRVGFALWDGAKSSDGVRQQVTMDGQTPVRSPRDPLASVRGLLANYVVGLA